MTVTTLPTARVHKLRARIRDLESLRSRISNEIAQARTELTNLTPEPSRRTYRPRSIQPPCGTEAGYQWHRYHEKASWPLPSDDPCGCRQAHRQHYRDRMSEQREGDVAC